MSDIVSKIAGMEQEARRVNDRMHVNNASPMIVIPETPTLKDRFFMAALTGLLATPQVSGDYVPTEADIISTAWRMAGIAIEKRTK